MTKPPIDPVASFWTRVTKTATCWPWTGYIDKGGYGYFGSRRAHRYSYELHFGPIPAGLYLDHLCHSRDLTCRAGDNCPHRRCVNPAHLEAVTPRENTVRGLSAAGLNAFKTHCLRGHEFTPENTYVIKPTELQPSGARGCRECRRAARARYELKRRPGRQPAV